MQNVEYIDHMGSDASVVRAARVSSAGDTLPQAHSTDRSDKDDRLIAYLAKHSHWTPFAHTAITLRMTAPVPIRTQCFKHKVGFSENEESRRYISCEPQYFLPLFRGQVENKKQGSGRVFSANKQARLQQAYTDYMEDSIRHYERLLRDGVCEEQARFVLPQGCLVNWNWTGSLSAFARFYKQRSDSHAQVEIQELASKVSDIIQPLYPVSWAALTSEV